MKKTSKQDEQDSSTDSSTRLTPRLKDDSSPNLSTNGRLNRQPTPPSPPTQHQYSYPSWRAPPHGGLPPSSYWGFRDSSFIPQGFRPVFLPIVDIPHNHLIGCVDWLLNATLFHEALDPCFYLLSIFCTTTFIGCVDRLLNATLFHEALDPCFLPIVDILHNHLYWLRRQALECHLIPQGYRPSCFFVIDIPYNHFIGCVNRPLHKCCFILQGIIALCKILSGS